MDTLNNRRILSYIMIVVNLLHLRSVPLKGLQ